MENTVFGTSVTSNTSQVVCRNSQEVEVHGPVLRLNRHLVAFEIYNPQTVLQLSEVLTGFKVIIHERPAYSGKAVVSSLVNIGNVTVCEATLEEGWNDVGLFSLSAANGALREGFGDFLRRWQKLYKIRPEFKLVVGDLHSFLSDLRCWMEQLELDIRSLPPTERAQAKNRIARELLPSLAPTMDALVERFENTALKIESDLQAVHGVYLRRQLHPLLMCSPFMHRIFDKPLGYAGDYEMMNMIWRNQAEGGSLFAGLLNAYILDQAPARSVRNRVEHMTDKITREVMRVSLTSRPARIYSIGCGPAREVQNFLAHPLAEKASIRLLDFNEETISHAGNQVEVAKSTHRRSTPVQLVKKSVYYLLKENGRASSATDGQDLIYSSGLYDYLNDRTARSLNSLLYDQLLPGGLLIISNFDSSNPIRNLMEYAFEWFLIHRTSRQMAALIPEQATEDHCVINADPTGCNVFLEVRKPLSKT